MNKTQLYTVEALNVVFPTCLSGSVSRCRNQDMTRPEVTNNFNPRGRRRQPGVVHVDGYAWTVTSSMPDGTLLLSPCTSRQPPLMNSRIGSLHTQIRRNRKASGALMVRLFALAILSAISTSPFSYNDVKQVLVERQPYVVVILDPHPLSCSI